LHHRNSTYLLIGTRDIPQFAIVRQPENLDNNIRMVGIDIPDQQNRETAMWI